MSGDVRYDGIRGMLMRGGTSKGLYFLAADLPADVGERDDLLLRIMGSPDPRQIDGIGGAHPLTSKVAVVSRSALPGVDLDYLFLQVMVDKPIVTDQQNCGNILAGIGPFAVERGLVAAGHRSENSAQTRVRIRMVNTDGIVTATFPTADGRPRYDGDTAIDGVPGTAAPVVLDFEPGPAQDSAPEDKGPPGGVFPTGNVTDTFDGITVTCVNNGMPVVVVAAASLGRTGHESIAELEADEELNKRVLRLRLEAGRAMGLGDVSATTVPKISLVSAPTRGGTISTRTFIPVRVHESIGVLGAVSVAAAVMLPGAVGSDLAVLSRGGGQGGNTGPASADGARLTIEHPSGALQVEVELDTTTTPFTVKRSGVVRTARKLFEGTVFPR
jgi:4-oxalomesaconate tautomerase